MGVKLINRPGMHEFSIGQTRNRVSLYCSTLDNILPHTYSTIVLLELWPMNNKLVKATDKNKFRLLIELISVIRKSIRRGNESNTESLAQDIYSKFIAPLSVEELKQIIGESSVCKFPQTKDEGMLFSVISTNPPVLRQNYLNIPKILSEASTQTAKPISVVQNVQTTPTTPAPAPMPQVSAATNTPTNSQLIQVKRELEQLYDKLVDNRGGASFNKPTYIWEWSFNIDEYHEITNAALKCNNLTTNQEKESLLRYDKCVFIIAAYVAERYKREWNGHSGTDNALIQIGYKELSEQIANKYFKQRSDLMIFRHDNAARTHEYLESLRMEGGLPVKRINGDTALADFAEYLYDETDRAIDILSEIGNECMKYSYNEKLSIYHYTMQLLQPNGLRNIYGSDIDTVADIGAFANILATGRAEAERKKTRLIFEVWHDAESNSPVSLTPILHMYPEDNGDRHFALSPSRLTSWRVDNVSSINSFTLDFVDADGQPITIYDENYSEMDSIYFSKCYNGDFVEFNARNRFLFPTIQEENLSMETIHLSNCSCRLTTDASSTFECPRIIPRKQASKDYIQLYSNDNKFWVSNKGPLPFRYSALIVKVSKNCHPTNNEYENLSNGLVWVPFMTHVELCINGTNKVIYNAQGSIYAYPQDACIHPICRSPYAKHLDNGFVEFYNNSNGETDNVYLIRPSDITFDVYREDKRTKQEVKVDEKQTISYRQNMRDEWQPYTPTVQLNAGYIEFNVVIGPNDSTIVKCFVLPSNCDISIELHRKRVLFNNIECEVKHGNRALNIINDTTYTYILPTNKGNALEGTDGLLTFSVHCNEGHFHVMTLHPVQGIFYMLNNGIILSSKQNNLRTVPLAFIGRFRRIKLDAAGGNIEHIGHTSLDAYKYVLEQQFNCTLPTLERGKEVDGCRYIAYSGSFEKIDNKRAFKVPGNTELQLGCFYFLSLKSNEIIEIPHGEDRTLNLESIEDEGILFQSLKSRTPMDVYLRPMYVPDINSTSKKPKIEDRKLAKNERIKRFIMNNSYLTDFAYRCFDIAAEHGLYFSTFDILLSLIAEYEKREIPKRICKFLAGYEDYCKKTNTSPNYTALWRLSTEFVFDWLFISKNDYDAEGVNDIIRNGLYESRPPHRIDDIGEYNTFVEWINSDNKERTTGNSVKNSLMSPKYSIFKTPDGGSAMARRCDFLSKAYCQTFKEINNRRRLD